MSTRPDGRGCAMVTLRDVVPEDKATIRAWRNAPDVAAEMLNDHLITPEEHDRWFARTLNSPTSRFWVIVHDNQDIGVIHLRDIDRSQRRCRWGFYVASPAHRGRGVASAALVQAMRYAFEDLQLHTLSAEVLVTNDVSLRLHLKLGFREEGRYHGRVWKHGKAVDVVSLSILRPTWEATERRISGRVAAGASGCVENA